VSSFEVAGGRLTTAGVGDTRPVADNATEQGRVQNRRVELVKR
jgi:outer membrane protein OmpA-like peptidoglycan-associated protein